MLGQGSGSPKQKEDGRVRYVTSDEATTDPRGAGGARGQTVEAHLLSTSDERVVNNVMRHEYRVLSETEKQAMRLVKDVGVEFWKGLDAMGSSRELSLAKTKIEEAVMWAVKHITG